MNEPDSSYADAFGDARAMLLIVDDAATALDIVEAARAADVRTSQAIGFREAAACLAAHPRIEAILIDTTHVDEGIALETLARVDAVARERSIPVIASFPEAHIDLVSAQMQGERTQLLCDPTAVERCGAIALATPRAVALNETPRDAERRRLRQLNEEVARIAETLARLARSDSFETQAGVVRDRANSFAAQPVAPLAGGTADAGEIRAAIRTRRLRDQFFDRELFADPAWDMLLDLFAAHLERGRVSVSSLCIAAAVPPTTALRWIGTMRDAGLVERQDDPFDRRRAFIGLTAVAAAGMHGYVAAVKKAGLAIA